MEQFPAIGHVYEANFNDGMILVHLDFAQDGSHMTFSDAGSTMPGMKPAETITYTAVEVRPQVFLVSWQEKDKMTVVHLEDFEKGIIRTHITAPTGDFYQFGGTLKQIR
jgi:hypothetical protein